MRWQHETLTDLNLGSNDLSMESGIALAREMGTHRRLQKLDLGTEENAMYANRFNNLVGVAFGQALQNNNTLKELGLNGVGIGRTSEKKDDTKFLAPAALGMMLQRNTYLQASCSFGIPTMLQNESRLISRPTAFPGLESEREFLGDARPRVDSGGDVQEHLPEASRPVKKWRRTRGYPGGSILPRGS
jgi:hypothetical protein